MDECARETVLEAMQQNNLRPFGDARNELLIEDVTIPPPRKKGKKKGQKKKKAKDESGEPVVEEEPKWLSFETMKEAIDAGWQPGQSFSFVAKNCKAQKLAGEQESTGALGQL